MSKCDGPYSSCSRFFERAGGSLKRGAGSFYIIEKEDCFTADEVGISHIKDIFYVFAA